MKKTFRFIYCFLIFTVLWQACVSAEPQLPYIETHKDGIAYNSQNKAITDCIAYDYKSSTADKFVRLDSDGRETSRASDPDALASDEEQKMGTVEFKAAVPDNMDNAVELTLWDSNGSAYTLTAYKDNGYTARQNIPVGTYTVFSVGVKDDYKGEYPAKCEKSEVVITESAATVIDVAISGKRDLTSSQTYIDDGKDSPLSIEGNPAATVSPSPSPTAALEENGEMKSLVKSTVITILILAGLYIGYRICIWYKQRKKKED